MKPAAILIGAGFVGKAHLDALRRLGVEVRGVLGSTAERSEEARASLGLDEPTPRSKKPAAIRLPALRTYARQIICTSSKRVNCCARASTCCAKNRWRQTHVNRKCS